MDPAPTEPELAVSWQDHTFQQLGIALTKSLAEPQIYSDAPTAEEDAGAGPQSGEIAADPFEDLYLESSAAPFDEGPEKAA